MEIRQLEKKLGFSPGNSCIMFMMSRCCVVAFRIQRTLAHRSISRNSSAEPCRAHHLITDPDSMVWTFVEAALSNGHHWVALGDARGLVHISQSVVAQLLLLCMANLTASLTAAVNGCVKTIDFSANLAAQFEIAVVAGESGPRSLEWYTEMCWRELDMPARLREPTSVSLWRLNFNRRHLCFMDCTVVPRCPGAAIIAAHRQAL